MLDSHAVGIDLGTTYSCIARLNEHGEPVTIPNQEGELSTPSVVFCDDDEVVVGTEALRNSIIHPEGVVQNAKRFIGTAKTWDIHGKLHTPVDILSFILKKLIDSATEQIGVFDRAVITVPAQFNELQRQATVEAGLKAGLKHVDLINEPVAAALCYVLGTEGLWFTELADEQRILVYDLGGGTFDLSLVRYEKNQVSVIASGGDLNLGGIDWNAALETAIAQQFHAEFGKDPRDDAESLQFLALEVENAKRSLSVRPKAALTGQHETDHKSYQVRQEQFEQLTEQLTQRTADITQQMLRNNKMGWAHVDVILTTGGASRMPMIRSILRRIGGRTLNTSLSPDQSIAHGATYYAGMLLTDSDYARSILSQEASARLSQVKQVSVNARALGILIRDVEQDTRIPHYLVEANTALPVSANRSFGTVVVNQKRVNLRIVESGTDAAQPFVELGTCVIDGLPDELPEGSEIDVSISYDAEARVHVSAVDVTSGRAAATEIVRKENLLVDAAEAGSQTDVKVRTEKPVAAAPPREPTPPKSARARQKPPAQRLVESEQPVPLCNKCGEPLDLRGVCTECGPPAKPSHVVANEKARTPQKKPRTGQATAKQPRPKAAPTKRQPTRVSRKPGELSDEEILSFLDDGNEAASKPPARRKAARPAKKKHKKDRKGNIGEDEFWDLDV
ncbi:MAG: heat-shock protein Hsp70 [Planctomycetaceae bacterium]|nr:heat-shock protein Hsp70 [Planctomycetaceae bacterium]